jgi:N-acetylglucosamine kinase
MTQTQPILCFDIGGSRIRAAMAIAGTLQPLGDTPTPLHDSAAFVAAITAFLPPDRPAGLAISIAGVVDPATGCITVANIPCINGRPLAADLTRAMSLPVIVLNDADSFAMAEAHQGAGRGHRNVFGVILGTGVGGGLVMDGRLVTGVGGYAGEWGHGPVIRGEFALPCGCGQVGCLDTVGGARGVERLHLHLHGAQATSTAIIADWQDGDRAAGATIALWRDLLAGPLAMVLNVVGASIVPVGGGLVTATAMIAFLYAAVRAHVLRSSDRALLVPAQCNPNPALIGAAAAGRIAFA